MIQVPSFTTALPCCPICDAPSVRMGKVEDLDWWYCGTCEHQHYTPLNYDREDFEADVMAVLSIDPNGYKGVKRSENPVKQGLFAVARKVAKRKAWGRFGDVKKT